MMPRATYRVQFGRNFGFRNAAAIAPYLAQLGISHVYASPYLQARPGSSHGYDITNHNELNRELGDNDAFEDMLSAFFANDLEHILDYVPNHMGVGGSDNPFWLDVLEWGRASRYAGWFDIDWDSHSEYLRGKLLVPFLGDQYGAVLESGEFDLKFDESEGAFSVWLSDTHKLPITPPTYAVILDQAGPEFRELASAFAGLEAVEDQQSRASELKKRLKNCLAARPIAKEERFLASLGMTGESDTPAAVVAIQNALQQFTGRQGSLESWNKLDSLIQLQHWRPAHFRVAADDINYRRFFNINELAGVRMELPEVFEHSHRLVFRLLSEGRLQGLRIDHIDGLFDPKAYLERLRASVTAPFYLVVEKILGAHETLPQGWPVEGTTGYEFCAQATALLVDPTAEPILTDFYQEFAAEFDPFAEIVRESKLKIMENELASELESLSRDAVRVARQNARTTDFTRNILLRALKQIVACFPVYRTYVDDREQHESDVRYIHWAIAKATKYEREVDKSVFEFLEQALTGRLGQDGGSEFQRRAAIRCAMKAQQLSGPVMAKGYEDTALYRYNRFVALNEVGSSPDHFGLSIHEFHKENVRRAERWPHTLLATSTHDVKHGEDARARLAALSLVPEEWVTKVPVWSRLLRARHGDVEGAAPPTHNDEYLFFQNLIATWPAELTLPNPLNAQLLENFSQRLREAMIKSVREARMHSNWTSPDNAYENAITQFVRDALKPEISQAFLENFLPFQQQVAEMGVRNSLVQVLLKVASPGVADFYQGSELWDLNLPDPDNRRPVDFETRQKLLRKLREEMSNGEDRQPLFGRLLRNWHDGGIKLAVIQRLLEFRQRNRELFERGSYELISFPDESYLRICAFQRKIGQRSFVAVACLDARLTPGSFGQTRLNLGESAKKWRNVITEKEIEADNGEVVLSEVFEPLPIALLVAVR
jgi:(1->4)-alpha-D-glucan 1-alpha-D-glucosylmutase